MAIILMTPHPQKRTPISRKNHFLAPFMIIYMLLRGVFVANKMYFNCFHAFSIVLYMVILVLCGNSVLYKKNKNKNKNNLFYVVG